MVAREFLRRFIEDERYLQNKPLETKNFIDFCKDRGVKTNEDELEFFEKEGLFCPIIKINEPPEYFQFTEQFKGILLNWVDEGCLFDPSREDQLLKGSLEEKMLKNDSQKIISLYSSFQIHWLIILKESYSFNINFTGKGIKISGSLPHLSNLYNNFTSDFLIKDLGELVTKLDDISSLAGFDRVFDFEKKKNILKKYYSYYNQILEFLLLIQSIYGPYGRSNTRSMRIEGTIENFDEKWWEKRTKFNPKEELKLIELEIGKVTLFYWIFSKKAMELLGVDRDDWIQLWKSFAWDKKDKIKDHNRLGIEYLQWALMLKRFIEDYCEMEILDIDEISNIGHDDILKFNPPEMDQYGTLLRASRNKFYSDKGNNTNYYHDKYKRLFYLANDFQIDYHPRLIVFVEGKTELKVLPKFFEVIGKKPEDIGIDIINIGSISKFFGPKFRVKNSKNKYDTIILNNFLNLINYTLNKWQTLPFFIGDNENDIKKLLDEGICLDFDYDAEKGTLPEEWYHIWDKDFELDNFTDIELATAINNVLETQIDSEDVGKIRMDGKGIKNIDSRIGDPGIKITIANVLNENLVEEYENSGNKETFERPVFKLIKKLRLIALRNHPPSNTYIESKNKEIISDVLLEKD